MGDLNDEVPQPDWAALYQRHRDAMHRVARRTLRGTGLEAEVDDVVMSAMESLMKKPPSTVSNWEAMLVQTTKRRALDLLRSAAVKHASSVDLTDLDVASHEDLELEIVEAVDRERNAMVLWDKLAVLDARHRQVAREYVGKARPRADVAAEMGVSPARISQMATAALKKLRDALEKEGVKP